MVGFGGFKKTLPKVSVALANIHRDQDPAPVPAVGIDKGGDFANLGGGGVDVHPEFVIRRSPGGESGGIGSGW